MLSKDFLELKLRKSNSNPSPTFDPLFHPYDSLSLCFSLLFHNELQQTSHTNSYIFNFLISLFISSISRQQERSQPGHPRPLPCLSNLLAWHGAGAWRARIRPPAAQYPSRQHCRPSLTLDPLHELQKMDGDNGEERTWREWRLCRCGKVATVAPPSDESPDRDS